MGKCYIYDRNKGDIVIVGIIPKNIIKGGIPIDNNVLNLLTNNNVSSLKVDNKLLPIYRIDPQGIIHLDSRIAKENENSIFRIIIAFENLNITAADFTDNNWHSGIHRNNSIILLENNIENNRLLEKNQQV